MWFQIIGHGNLRMSQMNMQSPPAASAGDAVMYVSCLLGGCEVRLRLTGGRAAMIASGCSGALLGPCCSVCVLSDKAKLANTQCSWLTS